MELLEFKYLINIFYIIIPLISIVILIFGYRKKEKIIGILNINIKMQFKVLKSILMGLGLILIVVSLLGPQTLKGYSNIKKSGLDIYILIDTSKSMLVEDIKPNRITRGKKIVEELIDNLEGDRIGFIPYSSVAYVQMPLTDDYGLAKMFLNVIDTDMIGGGGTNVGIAIKLAEKSFDQTTSSDKVIIILSDGEEHNKESLEVLNKIKSDNLKVYTIGIGTEEGELIPIFEDTGIEKAGYKKDNTGEFIVSKLDGAILEELSSIGGGKYYKSSLSGIEIQEIVNEIKILKRDILKTQKIKRYKQLYQIFLGFGILLFLLGYLIPERRRI